jgi:fatty acid desaturase
MRTSIGFGVGPVRVSQRVGLPRSKKMSQSDASAIVDVVKTLFAIFVVTYVLLVAYALALSVLVYGLLGSLVTWGAVQLGGHIPPSTPGVVRRETLNQSKAVAMWPVRVWNRLTR